MCNGKRPRLRGEEGGFSSPLMWGGAIQRFRKAFQQLLYEALENGNLLSSRALELLGRTSIFE